MFSKNLVPSNVAFAYIFIKYNYVWCLMSFVKLYEKFGYFTFLENQDLNYAAIWVKFLKN